MSDDVVIAKAAGIRRCILRAREEHSAAGKNFAEDITRQDAAVVNVARGIEQAIDLANHLVRRFQLGAPRTSAESFELLRGAGMIDLDLSGRLSRMVGFRNMAVHQYAQLDMAIVESVIARGLDDLTAFADSALRGLPNG